ncbi:hypothetical protein EJD97_001973 [Solanum chilense]|uniref:Uncharacterized protein n=1 Tax=Solanum chilense TaxID=4083 RepID=A0A6N2ANY1_SOLCI|nr:hypothetical protein EJD97_001973 [Solanum chilense]
MDKLREGIVKMSYSEPNAPLSEAKNLIHQHLDRRFLLLGDGKNSNPKRKGKSKRRGSFSNAQKKQQQKEKEVDPRHVVHLEQLKKHGHVRPYNNKEEGAKNGDDRTSTLVPLLPKMKFYHHLFLPNPPCT